MMHGDIRTHLKENQQPIRLLIVDSVAHSRESLATYLQLQDSLEVVGVTDAAFEAIRLAQLLQPDVVIMDVHLPDENGFTATRQLLALDTPPSVILLTVHRRVQDVLQAQEAGAVAYIEKSAGVDAILDTLRALSNTQQRRINHV